MNWLVDALVLIGLGLVAGGVYWAYPPAGLVMAGLALVALATVLGLPGRGRP